MEKKSKSTVVLGFEFEHELTYEDSKILDVALNKCQELGVKIYITEAILHTDKGMLTQKIASENLENIFLLGYVFRDYLLRE